MADSRSKKLAREYLSGSLASSLTYFLFSPLEVVKTRLQIQDAPGWRRIYHSGFLHTTSTILSQDGLLRFWGHGLAAGVCRDFFYSGIRTGMYPTVRDAISAKTGRAAGDASLFEKIVAGATTGSAGAGLANAFDVVRVRMLVDGGRVDRESGVLLTGLRQGLSPRWTSSLHCALATVQSEGLLGGLLLRGISASMSRAGLLTAAQMSTYDHAKVVGRRHGVSEGTTLHVGAALLSGLAAAAACNPADVIKSRLMCSRSSSGSAGVSGPSGAGSGGTCTTLGAAWHILVHEGPLGFYRGFLPSYARLGPTLLIQLPVAEMLRRAFGVQPL